MTRTAACWAAASSSNFRARNPLPLFASPPAGRCAASRPDWAGVGYVLVWRVLGSPLIEVPYDDLLALAHARCALAPCGARLARCRLQRQPPRAGETGRPARDCRQRPGAGHELRFPAVRELYVRHDICADCREPAGGSATPAARRPTDARNPPRPLAHREPACCHRTPRCARPEWWHRRVDLPARGGFGNDVYLERNDASH